MAHRDLGSALRAACLEHHDRHALLECANGGFGKRMNIVKALDMQTYRSYPGVIEQGVDVVVHAKCTVIANA